MSVLLTRTEVEKITGFSTGTIYRLMRAGRFPVPIKIGENSVRWKSEEIQAWIDSRPRATGEKPVEHSTSV